MVSFFLFTKGAVKHNKTPGRELIVLKEKRKKEKTQHCVLCQKPAGVHSSLL